MLNLSENLLKSIQKQPWAQTFKEQDFWRPFLEWVNDFILPEFLSNISNQVDEIIDIDPDLSDPEILTWRPNLWFNFLRPFPRQSGSMTPIRNRCSLTDLTLMKEPRGTAHPSGEDYRRPGGEGKKALFGSQHPRRKTLPG
jgi:hypothetical protein